MRSVVRWMSGMRASVWQGSSDCRMCHQALPVMMQSNLTGLAARVYMYALSSISLQALNESYKACTGVYTYALSLFFFLLSFVSFHFLALQYEPLKGCLPVFLSLVILSRVKQCVMSMLEI